MSTRSSEDISQLEIVSIGNAIVDILSFVDDEVLVKHSLVKASMQLCSHLDQDNLLEDVNNFTTEAGGSAANTICSLSGLGIKAGFMGTISDDHWGLMFEESFKTNGVVSLVKTIRNSKITTATSVILITPDSERTMNTHLGVASFISESTIDEAAIASSPILYIEGYAFDKSQAKEAVLKAVTISHKNQNKVALTLSDPECVKRHRSDFIDLVSKVDILFANEHEISNLWGCERSELTLDFIQENAHNGAPITVITQSERGCCLLADSNVLHIPAITSGNIVDLTGAGDQFAAGFIFGLTKNWDIESCGRFGVQLATKVIAQVGPRINKDDLHVALNQFELK